MSNLPYKIGLRLAQIPFVRSAIDEKADLSAFDHKPTVRIVAGVSMIGFSYLIGWPAISTLGGWALYFHRPWIAAIGGPVLYGLSHLCFLGGMALSGAKYARLFLRWLSRVGVEKLLSFRPAQRTEDGPPPSDGDTDTISPENALRSSQQKMHN